MNITSSNGDFQVASILLFDFYVFSFGFFNLKPSNADLWVFSEYFFIPAIITTKQSAFA
jgi:hypothetical protein